MNKVLGSRSVGIWIRLILFSTFNLLNKKNKGLYSFSCFPITSRASEKNTDWENYIPFNWIVKAPKKNFIYYFVIILFHDYSINLMIKKYNYKSYEVSTHLFALMIAWQLIKTEFLVQIFCLTDWLFEFTAPA